MNALQNKDKAQVMAIMRQYKENGVTNYKAILSVPERLPAMYKREPERTTATIAAALFQAFESMNLSRPMSEDQILDLTETIIDSSNEDYIALEDLVMFLQGLIRGKYGPLYESMDIPKFMEKFELYRLERHRTLMNHREEQHANNKALGMSERLTNDREKEANREAMVNYLKETFKEK